MLKINDKLFERKMSKQRYKKGYSDSDCWGISYWFTSTFPEMVKTLRNTSQSCPCGLEFEEVDEFPLFWITEQSKILLEQKKEQGFEEELILFGNDKYFDRWWLILSRIAYCLEQADEDKTSLKNEFKNEFENKFFNGKGTDELKRKYFDREYEIFQYRDNMMKEAFDLIKKYFWALCD